MHSNVVNALIAALALCTTAIATPIESHAGSMLLPKRADGTCALCEIGPGDCQGEDLDAYNKCVQITRGSHGDCMDLEPGTGAQDGCLAAQISIMKPCENGCVQKQLTKYYCEHNPGGKGC